MHTQHKILKSSGFTIVELLIVIVVIAILAAISIVAYNGIQQRANNNARIANASNSVKLLSAYIATYGQYPLLEGNSCIGNGFAENNTKCWGWNSATPSLRVTAFNDTELVKVGSLPNNTTPPVQGSSWQGLGPVYIHRSANTVDGVSNPLLVLYFLDGANQDCGLNRVVRYVTTNTYETVSTSPKNSGSSGSMTTCYVAVSGL